MADHGRDDQAGSSANLGRLRNPVTAAAAAVVTHAGDDSRISMSRCAACVSENIRRWPHRLQVIRMNHDGNARNGSSRASLPVGSGSVP